MFLSKKPTHYSLLRSSKALFSVLLIMLMSTSISAEESSVNDHISFEKPWVRLLPPTMMHTAGYVTIKNSADTQDKLLAVWSPTVNSVSVHQTKEVDGLFTMLAADNVVISPKGELKMQPGGYHIMIMGLNTPLTESSELIISFEFEKAGIINVVFPAQKTAP